MEERPSRFVNQVPISSHRFTGLARLVGRYGSLGQTNGDLSDCKFLPRNPTARDRQDRRLCTVSAGQCRSGRDTTVPAGMGQLDLRPGSFMEHWNAAGPAFWAASAHFSHY